MSSNSRLDAASTKSFTDDDVIDIDLASIPEHVREDLAAATYSCVMEFMRQPGGKATLDAVRAYNARI